MEAVERAIRSEKGYGNSVTIEKDALQCIARQSLGDVRYALNLLELAVVLSKDKTITMELLSSIPNVSNQRTSKEGDGHYIPHIKLGVDQQMRDFGQAATAIEAFADVLEMRK